MNKIKSGMWTMMTIMSLIIFISSLFKFNHIIFTIISVAIGVLSFFFGFFYYIFKSNHRINDIYMKLKEINANQNYGSEDTIDKSTSDINDDENLIKSKSTLTSKNSESNENEINSEYEKEEEEEEEEDKEEGSSILSGSENSEDIHLINNHTRRKINIFNSIDKICKLTL